MGIRIAAISPKLKVADCRYNIGVIIEEAKKAYEAGCSVVLFPELSITSCSCGDLFSHTTLIEAASNALELLVEETKYYDIYTIVGLPVRHKEYTLNCAAVVYMGKVEAYIPKLRNSPDDRLTYHFDEPYTAGFNILQGIDTEYAFYLENVPYRVLIGDDIFCVEVEEGTVYLNPSSNPVISQDHKHIRVSLLLHSKNNISILRVNPSYLESTSNYVYGGSSIAVINGFLLAERKPFEDKEIYVDFCDSAMRIELKESSIPVVFDPKTPFLPTEDIKEEYYDEILASQAHALAKRVLHTNCKKIVVGISGGLDSTLALIAAYNSAKVLKQNPKDLILPVIMPSFGSSSRTRENAKGLCQQLNIDYRVIDISEAVTNHLHDISHDGVTADITYENAQARERTQILMDICNMENGIMLGTGDLSELALGFTTYGGDQMSMYGINASIPKTLVKALVIYCGDKFHFELKEILYDIANTPISPELLPLGEKPLSQRTEDLIGPYELHDYFIYSMFVNKARPKDIHADACIVFGDLYEETEILKWLKVFYSRFFASQFKRVSIADSPKITRVSLSDLYIPSDLSGVEWIREIEEI